MNTMSSTALAENLLREFPSLHLAGWLQVGNATLPLFRTSVPPAPPPGEFTVLARSVHQDAA